MSESGRQGTATTVSMRVLKAFTKLDGMTPACPAVGPADTLMFMCPPGDGHAAAWTLAA